MFAQSLLLFAVSCAAVFSDAHPLEERQGPAIADAFNIYAYGEGISGLPIFYADGAAQLGDPSLSTAEVVQDVYFTVSETSPNTWIAHPNRTVSGFAEAPFESVVFTLPPADASGENVSFEAPSSSLLSTNEATAFDVYGNYVLLSGGRTGNFYAVSTDTQGVWGLVWSAESSQDVAVTLRTIAPATEAVL
ncbi:uncharacterized protein BDV17DRAFT_277928 [Aspergillus undulatus]|uniref:uncharacterized protein n=1 Tax=Aspergillus undulatus TaxID=1810928 RepID=UPI003CCCCD61